MMRWRTWNEAIAGLYIDSKRIELQVKHFFNYSQDNKDEGEFFNIVLYVTSFSYTLSLSCDLHGEQPHIFGR